MANTEASLAWFAQRQGKVSYSMGARYGPNSYDCSSAVYNALVQGGFLPQGKMGNTESLFGDLEAAGWQQTNSPVRGDVFIWGARGASSGGAGHTGMFVDTKGIIHCNGGANGISTDFYQQSHQYAGSPPAVIYHNPNNNAAATTPRRTFSETEQNAITLYKVLKPRGYSLQAMAAKCGNADVEAGMRPNVAELSGGPGYGLYQWTSSNRAERGIDYVRRLMQQAGISGDVASMESQVLLGDWHMTNGQWIGAVDPLTVDGFKSGTDVNQLTLAFLRNFERAGVEKLQDRQAAAQRWYQFLVEYEKDPDAVNLAGAEEPKQELKNAGELEEFGIKDGKIFAKGWHFSSYKPNQTIQVIDATNDKVVHSFTIELKKRDDIKEKYSDVEGVELCGFELSFSVADGQSVYLKGIRANDTEKDELIFDGLLLLELAENAEVDHYAEGNESFWFEILENDKVKARGKKILNELEWSNGLMETPETEVVLPVEYSKYFTGREHMKLYINRKVFHGIVVDPEVDNIQETITIPLVHVIDEWNYRQLSTNLACKNRTISDIYSTYDFRYSKQWHVEFLQDAAKRRIDYVYSRQTKLEALDKTCNLTDDIFWRVGFHFGRLLQIGKFREKKDYRLTTKIGSKRNIRIIEEPIISTETSSVVNMATVYGEKSDSGMSSMSLRDAYFEPKSQIKGFPIRILKNGINNERGYDYINYTKLAPNNSIEYTVIDEESIKTESNTAIESAFAFNDMSPFAVNGDTISDEDRAKATRTAYEAAVKKLKLSRRRTTIQMKCEQLPNELNVGDQIRFMYDSKLYENAECSDYEKQLMLEDDWFYITKIDYIFDKQGGEVNQVTLTKTLLTDRSE